MFYIPKIRSMAGWAKRSFLTVVSFISACCVAWGAPAKNLMFDPLFAIRYDPQHVQFELAPATIAQNCSDLKRRKLWVYAKWTQGDTTYFIVSGFIANHPDGPGKADISPDEDGIAVAIREAKCTTDDAMWMMSGVVDPKRKNKLPETYPERLPGHDAPRVCDQAGTCHYAIRSREAEQILEGLAADAMQRFAKAFGGKQAFLNALQKYTPSPDDPPILTRCLDAYRKGN